MVQVDGIVDELDVLQEPWRFRQVVVEVKCRTSAHRVNRQPELHEQVGRGSRCAGVGPSERMGGADGCTACLPACCMAPTLVIVDGVGGLLFRCRRWCTC